MTKKSQIDAIKALGCTVRVRDGEWRISIAPTVIQSVYPIDHLAAIDRNESLALYCDRDDALDNAKALAASWAKEVASLSPPRPPVIAVGTYDTLAVEAALCLWEAALERSDGPWHDWREESGTMALRRAIMAMGAQCSADWFKLSPDQMGFGNFFAFDWDYCPAWLALAVDWANCPQGSYPSLISEENRLQELRDASEVTSC